MAGSLLFSWQRPGGRGIVVSPPYLLAESGVVIGSPSWGNNRLPPPGEISGGSPLSPGGERGGNGLPLLGEYNRLPLLGE